MTKNKIKQTIIKGFQATFLFLFLMTCNTGQEKTVTEKLDKKAEVFLISNHTDTLLEGKEGTLVFIEKESFIDQNGNEVSDSVEITLKEVYQMQDILTENISMRAGEKLLETGGMIQLQAFANQEALNLRADKSLVVHFPKGKKEEEMNLFYGSPDSTNNIVWDLENSSTYRLKQDIVVWYTKYEALDHASLYLANGENVYTMIHEYFDLNEKDEKELLNKNIHANYLLFYDGQLEYLNITGSKISKRLQKKIAKKMKNFPRCKPYTREGVTTDMPGFFSIETQVIPPLYQSNTSYLATIEQKMANKNTKGLDVAELQYYIFDSRQLGWMNCDRFLDYSSSEITNYVVNVPKSKNIFAKIVFSNYKTVMTGDEEIGKFTFADLPVGEPIKIVVLDEKRGKPLLKIVDTKIQKEGITIKDLTSYSMEELQQKLADLN